VGLDAYDAELDLLFIGTATLAVEPGAAQPRRRQLVPVVDRALRPDDGSYVWHYQTTPGESWDYTATQPIVVPISRSTARRAGGDGGAEERLLLCARRGQRQAALGRQVRGRELRARDLATGRPIENPPRATT